MTTAVQTREGVAVETGEVVALPVKFAMKEYLQQVQGDEAIALQQQLAGAYDKACSALIGPNDVQREGKRTFKKKSAWRKLARHFGISVKVVRIERDFLNEQFTATVTAQAIGPWGQLSEDVGACCADEATGRRVITVADAIATAATRATNRAISNLIAMGEVSAEEIGNRRAPDENEQPDVLPDPEPTSDTPWPGSGPVFNKKLAEWSKAQLLWLVEPGRRGPHIDIWQSLGKDELKRRENVRSGTMG